MSIEVSKVSRTVDTTPYGGGSLNGLTAVSASADPLAGTTAGNGLPIWSEDEAADNLARPGVTWWENNYGELDDGVLTYGFWTFEELMESYYVNADGTIAFDEAFYADNYGLFEAFTVEQEAAAAATIELWDDLIAISIERADSASEADITFGATYMSPAAGAYAYYPSGDINDDFYQQAYGFEEAGRASGDVWINWLYNSPTGEDGFLERSEDDTFSNLTPGAYAWWALAHELGHSMGLAHGGEYNASDDDDGDGNPDPITYANDAYFYQDSQQYTMMSYFSASNTGADWIDWGSGGYFAYAQTPMVHDVLAVQNLYGADMTTRADDTVYGFNSTLPGTIFDFTQNSTPVMTIWDGGGNDTLDLSGYSTNSIIDINEGAFSSAGHGLYEFREMFGIGNWTQAQVDAYAARNGYGDGGRPEDNIAIAYGAEIENAVGGSGHDLIIGNALDNVLKGGAGNDVIAGGAGTDQLYGGAGNDVFVFTEDDLGYADIIRDFESGKDTIDLTSFDGLGAGDVKFAGKTVLVDTDGDDEFDLTIVVQGDRAKMSDIAFADSQIDLDDYVPNQDYFLVG